MVPSDQFLWSKIVSPSLRALIPGVTTHVSSDFVESLQLEDCGEFVWALVCLSRGAPTELLGGYAYERAKPAPEACGLLLYGALEAPDFYGFAAGALAQTIFRLKRNVDSCAAQSDQEEAHEKALERIEDVIAFLAERHPKAADWLSKRRKRPAVTTNGQRLLPGQPRSRAKLTLVR